MSISMMSDGRRSNTDTAITIQGNLAVGEQNRPYAVTGREEIQQRLYIRLSAVKGGFLYDPALGSGLATMDMTQPDALLCAEAQARQALAEEIGAEVTGVSWDNQTLTVFVHWDGADYAVPVRRRETE